MKRLLTSVFVLLWPLGVMAGERLHVIEHATNETTTHVSAAAKSDSVGDLLTFANPVFDSDNRAQICSDHGYCVRVMVGKSWECFWTLLLRDGAITIEGPFYDSGDSVMVITGGTGKYTGAKGQMKLHDRGSKPTSYDFIYELL